MAPPRKHETDAILDAARALVLTEGPRAASVAAIAKASGAPVGTLYHRFGNRDGILKATWLRGIERFQRRAMAADGATPVEVAVAMAGAVLQFARDEPEDARLLLTIRRADLLDGGPDADFDATLADMNAPVFERLHELARGIFGRDDDRAMDAVMRAVADLPYATVRRHIDDGKWPVWLSEDLATSVRRLLSVDKIVSASREIAAPSDVIFELIADPAQQPRWDGNENLLRMASGGRVRGVGEVFTMEIKQGGFRDNHVIEFEGGAGSLGALRLPVNSRSDICGAGNCSPPVRGARWSPTPTTGRSSPTRNASPRRARPPPTSCRSPSIGSPRSSRANASRRTPAATPPARDPVTDARFRAPWRRRRP